MKNQRDSGYSLLELLIALGIGSLVLFLSYRLITNIRKLELSTNDKLKVRSFSMTIENSIDCSRLSPSCKEGELLTLYSRRGQVLTTPDVQGKSGWMARAVCEAHSQFRVDALKVNPDGTLGKDALTGGFFGKNQPYITIIEAGTLCQSTSSTANQRRVLTQAGKSCFVYSQADLPCSPPPAPNCPSGLTEISIGLDTFGGSSDEGTLLYGQYQKRYCIENPR